MKALVQRRPQVERMWNSVLVDMATVNDPSNYLIVVVSVTCRPAALMSSGFHAAPAVRVLDVTHWILHELVVNFYLHPLTSAQQ